MKNQEQLKEIWDVREQEQENDSEIQSIFLDNKNNITPPDLGFDIIRLVAYDGNRQLTFDTRRTRIEEQNGVLGRIREFAVWDCGCSPFDHKFGVADAFGRFICEDCKRWCTPGRHWASVHDVREIEEGCFGCRYHTGLTQFFTKTPYVLNRKPLKK